MNDRRAPPLSVYVHFPFCLAKCPYCDFVSFARERPAIDHDRYADAVVAELGRRSDVLTERGVATVFFGGGTPSLWKASALGRVLSEVCRSGGQSPGDVEVTVECNPSSLDASHARALRDVGVGRLSIGVQGLDASRLRFLGRLHDPDEGLAALDAALASGMPRVSADFIYGIEGGDSPQTAVDAASEVRRIAASGVSHVSAYSLTIEPQTRFGELARKGRLPIAVDDRLAESFFAVEDVLGEMGFSHYEVSNYAKPGQESQHNLAYWRGRDYLGLGCAAVGTITARGHARRTKNVIQPDSYMQAALDGAASLSALETSEESLDAETRMRERIMLGLRLQEGIDMIRVGAELGVDPWPTGRRRAADRLVEAGRLVRDGSQLRVPSSKWIFADGVAAELF